MAFKLYDDKSSVLKKNTRYVQGGISDVTSTAVKWWEKREDILTDQVDDIPSFALPSIYHQRPDLLSYALYGRPDLKWLILQYNNIVDINEEFVTGAMITAPSVTRAFTDILTNPIVYQPL